MPKKQIVESDFVSEQVVVEDIYLLFGIDLAGDKVINDQIISEEPSYEEMELKKYRDFSCMFCNISRKKNLASSTENDLEHGSTSSFFGALISCSLLRRSLLT
jgi:hypothetical protein